MKYSSVWSCGQSDASSAVCIRFRTRRISRKSERNGIDVGATSAGELAERYNFGSFSGFLDDLDEEAHHVHELHRSRQVVTADTAVAARLRIPPGSQAVRFQGTRVRNGKVYGVATDVLPAEVANRIDASVLDRCPTIVDAMEAAGCRVRESLQRVEPTTLDAATAWSCGSFPGAPALAITGVAYGAGGAPLDAYTLIVISGYGIGLHLVRASHQADRPLPRQRTQRSHSHLAAGRGRVAVPARGTWISMVDVTVRFAALRACRATGIGSSPTRATWSR